MKIGYIISASTLCINIVMNYCFIYGNFGAPEMGIRGAAAIAANSIATIVFQIISVVVYGSSSATSILVGKTIGEGKEDWLHEMVSMMKRIFIGIGIITGLLIFAVRVPVLMLYNISDEANYMAMQFIAVIAVTTVGTAYQVPCDNGIIRGGGDTSFSMKLNLVNMWMIVVPFSALAAFLFYCPPVVVFFLLKWDQIYKILSVTVHLNSWKWVKHVTRGNEKP